MRRIEHRLAPAACLFALLNACGGRIGTFDLDEKLSEEEPAEEQADLGPFAEETLTSDAGAANHEYALEEMELEDPDALASLISDKLASKPPEGPAPVLQPGSGTRVPDAQDNWKLTKEQCFERLDAEGVRYTKPDFETPLVDAPMFLAGPINGVDIRPHWPQPMNANAVMDCRLALALVEAANQARALGIKEIQFYSTYRPIKAPPETCNKGGDGKRCRRLKQAYEKAKKRPSQHRAALAIDIRWLITYQGELIDVFEHYDRRSGEPPCEYDASTYWGRILQSFACGLYREHVFNVMLTPNANKAHHNHFHFDITPGAKWYIIR